MLGKVGEYYRVRKTVDYVGDVWRILENGGEHLRMFNNFGEY